MLGFFRNFFQSRFGVIVTLSFLAVIAIAFASADITGGSFGGVAGGDRAANVGKARVGTGELQKTVTSSFESERQKNPALTMSQFLASGGLDEVLTGIIDRAAMMEWGKLYGMTISDRLVDSEIVKIPAFQGPDGKFAESAYKQLLAQRGLTDQIVRDDLAKGLMARQLLVPASFGAVIPRDAVTRYAALLKERRVGTIAIIPSLAFAPKAAPDDKTLAAFYAGHTGSYMRPERRVIRYAVFDEASLKNVPAPTDGEIAARYKLNAATYSPSETRNVTQVIVPTEAAAQALAAEVARGGSLETAASSKGLAAGKLTDLSRESLSGQASKAVADAVFAGAQGKIIAPARSGLGWHVIRIDAVNHNPGKTLDQAKPEIVAALTTEKRHAALSDLSAKIEEQFDSGNGLADAAKTLGVAIATSEPLQSDGSVFGKPGQKAPEVVGGLVQTAFSMERENEPQLAELQAGTKFAIFDVAQITAAAPAPLAEIRDQVARDYATDQGFAQSRAAAEKVLAALAKGTPLADALKSLGIALPVPQAIDLNREQLTQMQQRVPPPLALLFSMAQGTTKRLEAPDKAGWFIVSLKSITPGEVKADDPIIAAAQGELGSITGREYAEELRNAMRQEVGVKRNDKAIAAVRTQLTGGQ